MLSSWFVPTSIHFASVDGDVRAGRGRGPGSRDPECTQGSMDISDCFLST